MNRLKLNVSPRVLVAFVATLGISTFSCTHDVTSPPTGSESSAVKAAAADPSSPPESTDISFNLVFPSGYNIGQVAVGASGSLSLGSNDVVLGADGKPGVVTSTGTGATSLQPSVQAGDVVSVADISISPKGTVTSAHSAGKVSVGSNAKVGAVEQKASLTPLVQRTVTVHPPDGPGTDVDVSKKSPVSLAVGRYGQVTVGPDATLKLTAGTYLFDSFSVGPKSVVDLDTTDGSVNVYVNQSADWKGALMGDASRFVFGYLGTDTVNLKGTFRGTALAPNGGLKIELEGASNEGTFYGKDVTVGPNITIKKLKTPFLIGELKVSSDDICIGEQTEVTLTATGPSEPGTTTRIMGIVGDHQFVNFAHAPGPRTIYATIETANGNADFVSIPINTRACETTPTSRVALHFRGAGGALNTAEFMVRGFDGKGHETDVAQPASYAWDFGDGTKSTTTTPMSTHDYSDAVDPLKEYNSFNVSVTVTNSVGAMTAKKVVPLWSLYAKNRSKGIVQPPSTIRDLSASAYSLQVKNHEPTPIAITAARTDFIPCDPNLDLRPQTPQAMNVAIPAKATATVNVAPPTTIPEDVCAVGIHLMGTAAAGKVYSDAYIRAKENPSLLHPVTDPEAIARLNEAAAVAKDPNRFDGLELRELVAAGKLSAMPPAMDAPATAPVAPAAMKTMAMATTLSGTTGPAAGMECSPGEESDTPGLVCQPTPEWVGEYGQILNASKGHILMDHGCGNIGKLLGAIQQNYSHTMIMSQNRTRVRHSTASEDRMGDALDIMKLRLDADVVRYGYPGTAGTDTYPIDKMVSEYNVTDPNGKEWRMGAELSPGPVLCDNQYTIVPSLVVKPPPDAPLDLQDAVASMANPDTGALFKTTGHYRFYMYSRADQASLYPGEGWATGTEATVCSSFALDAASRTPFKGKALSLRPSFTKEGVPDGMQTYSIEQRKAAAQVEYSNIRNTVSEACEPTGEEGGALLGGFVGAVFGGPVGALIGAGGGALGGKVVCNNVEDNVGNQVTNCFAFDACADTSDRWKNPGTGIAVSPDNILDWDVPVRNDADGTYYGTYGYNEAMMYLPVVFRHKYEWKQTEGNGTLVVHVVHEDETHTPFHDARVYVNSIFKGLTPSTGDADSVEVLQIAPGMYDVEAQFNPCGESPEPVTTPHLPITQLPACVPGNAPSADGCVVRKPQACPGDYIERECQLHVTTSMTGHSDIIEVCGCYPKPELTCDKPLLRGGRPAEVKVGETTEVTITLCSNGSTSCPQACKTDADCDNNQVCGASGTCVPVPQGVKISANIEADLWTAMPDLAIPPAPYPPNAFGHFETTCNPLEKQDLTNWLCDSDHLKFCSGPITGGTAAAVVELEDVYGSCNEMQFQFVCTMDESGGVMMGTDMRYMLGCGSKASDTKTARQWRTLVMPVTRDNPAPAPLRCHGEATEGPNGRCEAFDPRASFVLLVDHFEAMEPSPGSPDFFSTATFDEGGIVYTPYRLNP